MKILNKIWNILITRNIVCSQDIKKSIKGKKYNKMKDAILYADEHTRWFRKYRIYVQGNCELADCKYPILFGKQFKIIGKTCKLTGKCECE